MPPSGLIYADSSALVKLVVVEDESADLRRLLDGYRAIATSALAQVEVPRAVAVHGSVAAARARRLVDTLTLVPLFSQVLDRTSRLRPEMMRSLDAIHVASALTLTYLTSTIVTYDKRMAGAAQGNGLQLLAPGQSL